ncbi:uncharacterized protein LOC111133675 [Crassostrea virginica]
MSPMETLSLRPLIVVVMLIASTAVCQDEKIPGDTTNQGETKRVFFNWRILSKIHRERPGFFSISRSRTGRSSDFTLENDVNALPLKLFLQSVDTETLPNFQISPDLFPNDNTQTDNSLTKEKKNLGRWRNTNWIYSIRPDGPKFNYLFKTN